MTYEVQTNSGSGTSPITLSFSSTIGAVVYGIQSLNLVSGSPGASIQSVGVQLSLVTGTGAGSSQLSVTPSYADGIDAASSSVTVAALAALGGAPTNAFLGNQVALGLGTGSSIVISTAFPPLVAAGVLAGFQLQFASTDSDMLGFGAGVGLSMVPSISAPMLTPVALGALLGDSSASGTVQPGYIATTSASSGLVFFTQTSLSTTGSIDASWNGTAISGGTVFLQSFYGQFDISTNPTADLESLQLGATNVQASGTSVTASVGLSLSGQVNYGNTVYGGGGPVSASVQNTASTYLVVGIVG